MQNYLECPNCKELNPHHQLVCKSCKAYIREKVYNIDFWSTFWHMFDSPIKQLQNLIFAEHKNFLIITLLLISFKFSVNTFLLTNLFRPSINLTSDVLINMFYLIVTFSIIFIFYSFLVKFILKIFKVKTRFKDNLAIFTYSQSSILFSLLFLFPVQLGVFGVHWFVFNPSPMLIKPNIAYALFVLEIILTIWGLVQIGLAHFVQTRSIIFSIFAGLFFYSIITLMFLYFPFIIS
jgi:hypothetical protein